MAAIQIPKRWLLPNSQGTPEGVFLNRRQVLRSLGYSSLGLVLGANTGCDLDLGGFRHRRRTAGALGRRFRDRFPARRNLDFGIGDRSLTPEEVSSSTNNFYEFSTNKGAVWELAQGYPVDPWVVEVGGLVHQPRTLNLEDLFRRFPLEERLYRFRCVERWAMQVPWTGFPLARLIDELKPLASARYVRFVSVHDPDRMPGQGNTYYPWPYYEALRLDEARHDLAFVVLGVYGHALPMQHGAPWRVICPWKYGYKSPKSIVRIEFTEHQPPTFWNDLQPSEYGFFSNVNPDKPHPRWSQAREEDIGTLEKRPTLLYNGYAEQVGHLYGGQEV
ncbi:MAG: protein-methionine-sulfoxide reductase catalytic subunit MsrP [Deltaproteobacteria bacterium]|nr:protein-methionine-sulfoxide reductase catalytic subunit MsrP [Deltaproteobacteria bacterium]